MRSIVLSLLAMVLSFASMAQELNPVKWTSTINHLEGNTYELTWTANIQKGWTVYSQFTSDDGPVPTSINYESEGFKTLGDATESGKKKEGFDKLFEVDVIKFLAGEPFVIKQKIEAENGVDEVVGYLTYMTCDDSRCLPPTDVDFTHKLIPSKKSTATAPTKEKSNVTKEVTQVTAPAGNLIKKKIEEAKQKAEIETQKVNETASEVKKEVAQIAEVKSVGETSTEEAQTEKFDFAPVDLSAGSDPIDDSGAMNEDFGGNVEPVKWSFKLEDLGNGEYALNYIAQIEKGWSVYSQFTSDDGPVPTYIEYEENVGVEIQGEALEKGYKKEGPDPLFDNVNVIKFLDKEPFQITQKVKVSPNAKLKGYLTYMTCDDAHCLPPTDVEFEVKFDDKYMGAPVAAAVGGTTGPTITSDNLVDQRVPSIRETYANPPKDCGGEETADNSLLKSFILGFLGGLVALLTPCVFPMIPITVGFFTKDNNRSGLANGLIYGASIIVIYVALGLILTAVFGGEALNALSTNWIANTIFFLIFLFFAFSFFGYYELTLPSSWTTKTDSMADKGGLIGIFFMAFTLALVSFSCTGPIIGSAIVTAAASSNTLGPAIVMFGFALALALPFGLFAAFPSWLNSLPRSGGWMTDVKVFLGFLELAFAFKFLSVADLTSNWNFLKYEVFMGIWVAVALAMALYFFGFIRFPHSGKKKKLSPIKGGIGLASLALAIYFATGFQVDPSNPSSYIPKGLTSGIAPPATYNIFLPKPDLDPDIKKAYSSYTKCANDIPCFKDYYQGLDYAKKNDKPVFLDFTGHGCVNCRKTEEFIWVDHNVKTKLSDDFVLISLYVDDRKKLEEKQVSLRKNPQGDNVKLRNVGNRWADFQIVNFEQNSQPLYVMMTNDEKVVSNPRGYHEGISGYIDYLDCGLGVINGSR